MSVRLLDKLRRWCEERSATGSIRFLAQRFLLCILDGRFPKALGLPTIYAAIVRRVATTRLYFETRKALKATVDFPHAKKGKSLFACPVGREGVPQVIKIIEAFGFEDFDFWIFVWDDMKLDDLTFKRCRVIYEKGLKWHFMQKYLTPDAVRGYDYVLPWDDDLELVTFKPRDFFRIFERNRLEVAQPALSSDSHYECFVTLQNLKLVGRFTDYCEGMAQVFRVDAWVKFWGIMESDYNHWGWGYDDLAMSLCGFRFMGIVDCQTIRHIRPNRKNELASREKLRFFSKYPTARVALRASFLRMK